MTNIDRPSGEVLIKQPLDLNDENEQLRDALLLAFKWARRVSTELIDGEGLLEEYGSDLNKCRDALKLT